MRRRWLLPLAVSAGLTLSACVEPDDDGIDPAFLELLETAEWPIVGGHTTTGWESVLLVGLNDSICSSTLIAPDVVLTAAHCLEGVYGTIDVYWCDDCYGAGYWGVRHSSDYEMHPHYNPNTMVADLGVILLNGIGPSDPIPINRDAAANSWLGNANPLTSIGFGVTSGNLDNSGTKREVDAAATSWDGTFLYYEDPNHNICFGDSGGPSMTDHSGSWRVAGVHSWVTGDCHDIGAMVRVDQQQGWIDGFTGGWTPDDDDDDDDDDTPPDDDDTGDDDTDPVDDDDDDDTGDDDTGDDDTGDDDDDTPLPGDLPSPRTGNGYDLAEGLTCIGSQAPGAPAPPDAGAAVALLALAGLAVTRRLRRRG